MLYLSMSDCVGAVITCAARAGGYPEASVPGSPSRSFSHFVRGEVGRCCRCGGTPVAVTVPQVDALRNAF